jgi:thymidylate synthase (FAD)
VAETKRPTSPAAEEILGLYFPVLDHGFVALVDYLGTDEDIERAARVSYGYGTRKQSATRGLLRYLRRHKHTTPSEMVELKFHCCMPMFIARQWIRHRTACLAEGTQVYFDLPGGIGRRGNQLYSLPIEEVWRRFQPTQNTSRPERQRNPLFRAERVKQMRIRQIDEETRRIQHTNVVAAYKNGVKAVFRMRLADGKSIECTADHRFFFVDGWHTLRAKTDLEERSGRAVWNRGNHFLYVNGTTEAAPALYQEREWLDRKYNGEKIEAPAIAEMCGVSKHTIRKWLRVHGLTGRGVIGAEPWNKGKQYHLGRRELSVRWREANRRARSGAASNFWRGGVASERDGIGRWTTQSSGRVHERNAWTCQLCHQRAGELHAHHIVPVWADNTRARDEANLTTLCGDCHRQIQGRELEFVERLGGPPVQAEWQKRPRVAWNKLDVAKLVRIEAFEYVGEKETYDLEVEGPFHNFVANGIVTHNSVNEYSGRYSLMPMLFYTPDEAQLQTQSKRNNQGRSGQAVDRALFDEAQRRWSAIRRESTDAYGWLTDNQVARELARIDLPLSTYTQWYWKIDLHNLLHFLTLRVDTHAQWEIQEYGRVMAGMLKRVAPLSYEAWIDYDVCGTHVSRAELSAIRALVGVDGEALQGKSARLDRPALEAHGMAKREVDELLGKLATPPAPPDFELDLSAARSAEHFAERFAAAVPSGEKPPE